MFGEFLHEAAVLVAVFAPLDSSLRGEPVSIGRFSAIAGISAGLLVLGVMIERQRSA